MKYIFAFSCLDEKVAYSSVLAEQSPDSDSEVICAFSSTDENVAYSLL
jgi:hypothetical protein